jgi:hypothetical protein
LAPCNFFLFPKMKLKLKGHRFYGLEEIQRESRIVLGTLLRMGLPTRVPAVATALGSMCRFTRGLY